MKITVNVTQRDIEKGCIANVGGNCPVARSFNRLKIFQKYNAVVGTYSVNFRDKLTKRVIFSGILPREATTFIADFDGRQEVKPFNFTIEIPDAI